MKAKAKNRFVLCLWLLLLCSPGFNLALAQSPLLVQAEYFYDTDPGLGNGSQISFPQDSIIDVNYQLDVSGLSPGFHKAYFRTKDENNVWSLTNVMNIYVEEVQQNPTPPPLPDIVRLEYFLDTDPGEGNGISIPFTNDSIIDVNFEIGLTSVPPGFHKAYFRTKDENNVWSLTNVMSIYVEEVEQNPAPEPLPDIVQVEYFLDTDPGEGNGISILFTNDSIIDVNFEIGLTNTSPGFHKAYFRTKDENNVWSLTNVMNIYVESTPQPQQPLPVLTGMEYFFDTDSGFGMGYPVEVAPDSIIDQDFYPDLTHLTTLGQHRLYARVKDENNVWSLVYNEPLLVNIIANFEANETEILQNGSVEFTDLSLGNATGWEWDFENDGVTDSYLQNPEWIFTEPGVFSVKLTVSDGVNENTYIREDYINVFAKHDLDIPAGWSGISSYVEPVNKSVEGMFAPYANEFIILASMSGFYYPAGGANTIGNWSNATGYQIKTGAVIEMELVGKKLSNHAIQIESGWNLIPVLSSCDVSTDQLFAGLSGFQIIKEVAGVGLYWPQYGINSLPSLHPGKAYWVASGSEGTVEFPACTRNAKAGTPAPKPENRSPWNDLSYTAVSHAIAIPSGALVNSGISQGDILGVFTSDGFCAGMVDVIEISSGVALTSFANDETTPAKDGFDAGEPLQFKLWSISEEKEIPLLPTFDQSLPNADGAFAAHGLSAVTGFKVSTGIASQDFVQSVQIYPNPSTGVINITGISAGAEITVSDARGRVVINTHHSSSGVACIDLSSVPAGVYLVKIQQNGNTIFKKLILQ